MSVAFAANFPSVRLGEIRAPGDYTFVGGPFGSDLTAKDYISAPGVPVIRGVNLGGTESRFVDDHFVFVSDEKADQLSRNLAFPGDLVFTQRGTLGQVAIIPRDTRYARYVISQSQMKLSVDPKIADSRYVYYAFRSPAAQGRLLARTQATGVPHINLMILKNFVIPLPPLSEQKRIADILDKADAIRRKREEGIRHTEELLRSTFLEMFGDPTSDPKKWPTKAMGAVVHETQYGTAEKSNSDGIGLPVLRMNNITYGGEIDLTDLKWCEIKDTDLEQLTVRRGDLLFNRTNSPELVGKTAVWDRDEHYAYAGYLFRVRFRESMVLPDYISGFLNSAYGKKMLFAKAKPSNNMSNFSAGEFRRIELPIPDIGVQRRFAYAAAEIKRFKDQRAVGLKDATELFGTLVQRAFQGEL